MLFVKRKSNAVDCVARVKGGGGTVEDPLRIEVVGNAGLAGTTAVLTPRNVAPILRLNRTVSTKPSSIHLKKRGIYHIHGP